MFPSRLPIDNNQETVPLSPRPFIKTGLAAEESDSSIYIRGANMKRYRLFQNIGLLTAMSFALVSCFKDELVGSRVNSRSNIIGFGISAATTADGTPLTRATQYADSALLMLGRGGADTLYLHASSENNISALDTSVATRGVPVNSSNFSTVCKNFSVTAFTPTGYYMKNVKVDNLANGIWSSDEEHFWPEDEEMTLDFFAYAPAVFGENPVFAEDDIQYKPSDSNGKIMSFDYTVPGSGEGVTNAAELQPDIMFAYSSQNKKSTDSATGSVPLTFYHALAGVKFVAKDITGGTVKSITLKNLYGAGTCTYTFTTGEPTIAWTDLDGQDYCSFSQEFNVKVNNQQTGEQDITDKKTETTFMMIPQNIQNAVVEILFNDGKTDYTLTGKLFDPSRLRAENDDDLKTWDAGKIYTYAISTESINWTYVFEVTETITLKLGETSAPYKVTSYRFRTSNPDEKQPVAWTAKPVKATETVPDVETGDVGGETSTIDNIEDVLVDYISEGDGLAGSAENLTLLLERGTLHTTYGGDITLKEADPKGSPGTPYDLSTSGGNRPQETANCYAINASGTYKLPLVYGNAMKGGKPNKEAYQGHGFKDYLDKDITGPWIKNSGQPADACLVWSDGFYMFENIHLDGDYLVFTINPDYMQQANAVLAVRDSQGRIMWSWHIWVTERTLAEVYHLQDGLDGSYDAYGMMKCNLGWVDGKIVYYNSRDLDFIFTQDMTGTQKLMSVHQNGAAFDYKDVGSTYYQWGRKDPLVALRNWEHVRAEDYRLHETSDTKYKYKVGTGTVSLGTAIQNPNIFYTRNASSYIDWLDSPNLSLWDASSTEGGAEERDKKTSVKTIYDPSPRGYKVPVPRAFSVLVNNGTSVVNSGGTLNGMLDSSSELHNRYFAYERKGKQGEPIPLTGTGQRADRGGLEAYIPDDGKGEVGGLWSMYGVYYWACIQNKETEAYTLVIRKDDKDRADNPDRKGYEVYSYGFSGAKTMARPVRCIEDRKD